LALALRPHVASLAPRPRASPLPPPLPLPPLPPPPPPPPPGLLLLLLLWIASRARLKTTRTTWASVLSAVDLSSGERRLPSSQLKAKHLAKMATT
jgi:hypothetical protein